MQTFSLNNLDRWIAWYPDAVYDGSRDSWSAMPEEDIQCVVLFWRDGTRTPCDGADWYWIDQGRFGYVPSGPEWGTLAEAPEVSCRSCLKRGTRLPDDEYERIAKEARDYHLPAD